MRGVTRQGEVLGRNPEALEPPGRLAGLGGRGRPPLTHTLGELGRTGASAPADRLSTWARAGRGAPGTEPVPSACWQPRLQFRMTAAPAGGWDVLSSDSVCRNFDHHPVARRTSILCGPRGCCTVAGHPLLCQLHGSRDPATPWACSPAIRCLAPTAASPGSRCPPHWALPRVHRALSATSLGGVPVMVSTMLL